MGQNEEYIEPTSRVSDAPIPPHIDPQVLAEQQGPGQGGTTSDTGQAHPAPQEGGGPASLEGGEAGGLSGDYDSADKDALQAEADRRELEVTGTGKDGNVVKSDLVDALEKDDSQKTG